MKRWSLGAKLTAWSTLVVAVALLICGIGAALFIKQEQIEALDVQLSNEAHFFFRAAKRLQERPEANLREDLKAILPVTRMEKYVEVRDEGDGIVHSSKAMREARLPRLKNGMHTLNLGPDRVRLGVFSENGFTLYLGSELTEINADSTQLLFGFAIGLPLLVATVAGGGWWLARKALAPVGEITAAARQLTAERLAQRLPVRRAHDEIGQLTEVLNAMFDRLEKSFHQAMRFSADASHELKTPLTILRAGIEDLLESDTLRGADQRAVSALLEQTRRLSSITQSLLLLARADSGRLRLDLQATDAAEIVEACVEDARIIAERRGISIGTELPSELWALLDEGRFSQVLLNLLDNAVKYNRDGGEVAVKARRLGHAVSITVANTGAGIPAENIPQVFERFYRFDAQPGTVGYGLGLSLARELARAHGGELELTSSDAAWTVFTLRVIGAEHGKGVPAGAEAALACQPLFGARS